MQLYWWSALVRAAAGLCGYWLTVYTGSEFLVDALFYESNGYLVATEWLSGRSVDFSGLAPGAQTGQALVTLIAGFYYVTGGVRAVPLLLIFYSLITAITPVYVYRMAGELGAPDSVARRAGWLVALSPAFVFWSGSLYKEGLTLLFLSLAAFHALRLQSAWSARSMAITVASILGLWAVRYYLAVVVMIAVVASLVLGFKAKRQGPRFMPVLLGKAVFLSAVVAVFLALGLSESAEHAIVEDEGGLLLAELDMRRADSARQAVSGYLREERIDTPQRVLQYLPVGVLYFLTVPFPWEIGGLRQNLVIPENTFWLLLYPLIAVGIIRAFRVNSSGTMLLLLMTVGMSLLYALISGNAGVAYRMRAQVWLLWAPFAAWGWEVWQARRRVAEARRSARLAARRRRVAALSPR